MNPRFRPNDGPGIYLIRNGSSIYNYWSKKYSVRARRYNGDPGPETDPAYKYLEGVKSKWDQKLLDPGLHAKGAKEARDARSSIAPFNVKYVLVSPMRRALETCKLMLESYPGREDVKIFVVPLLRTLLSNAKDIPYKSATEVKKDYSAGPLKFDFTLLEESSAPVKDLYFLDSLNSPEKETILDALGKPGGEDFPKTIIDIAKNKRRTEKKGQRKLETHENMRRRAVQFGEFLAKFISSTGLTPDDDILIFTHGPLIKYCLSVFWAPNGRALAEKPGRCAPAGFNYRRLLELEEQFRSHRVLRTGLTIKLMPGGIPSGGEGTNKALIIPLQTCAKGHQLFFARDADKYEAYDCAKCLKGGKSGEGRWNCLFCKYNLCQKCKPPPSAETLKKLCVRGHLLEAAAVPDEVDPDYRCARCGRDCKIEAGKKRACCLGCSYDVCPLCL